MTRCSPLITVVVPVYNRAAIVADTLNSIAAQTCREFKLILVDNNSTDDTPTVLNEWAANYRGDIEIATEMRQGAAAARAKGLSLVDTAWAMFFDSDDFMHPNHMERVIKAIEANPEAEIIGWDTNLLCQGKKYATGHFATRDLQYSSLFGGCMATQRYCARTSLFRKAGGWMAGIGVWDDIELGARLLALKPKVVKIKGISVDVHLQPDSLSQGEHSGNIARIRPALESISHTLGPNRLHWVPLKKIILAARGSGPEAEELKTEAIAEAGSRRRRFLFAAAFRWTRAGLPGAAKLLRIFM